MTKRLLASMLSLLFVLCLTVDEALACTTFCLRGSGEVLFGRNYDFTIGDALIFVNKRGLSKTATDGDDRNPAKWIAKYGSVTFNQFGRENPTGGMNEMGLVAEQIGSTKPSIRKMTRVRHWAPRNGCSICSILLRRLRRRSRTRKASGLSLT